MAKHIFLTGKKGVGKSTLLKKYLSNYTGNVGGFFTIRTQMFLKDHFSVHLIDLKRPATFSQDNLLFKCDDSFSSLNPALRKLNDQTISTNFNALGCSALQNTFDCDLIVIDELGPHEYNATLFRSMVIDILDGNIPVIGVLQAPAYASWPDIVSHPNVKIMEITEKNRNNLIYLKQDSYPSGKDM